MHYTLCRHKAIEFDWKTFQQNVSARITATLPNELLNCIYCFTIYVLKYAINEYLMMMIKFNEAGELKRQFSAFFKFYSRATGMRALPKIIWGKFGHSSINYPFFRCTIQFHFNYGLIIVFVMMMMLTTYIIYHWLQTISEMINHQFTLPHSLLRNVVNQLWSDKNHLVTWSYIVWVFFSMDLSALLFRW